MPINKLNMSLSNERRRVIRSVIAKHPQWAAYSADHDLGSVSNLSASASIVAVCNDLDINIEEALAEAIEVDAQKANQAFSNAGEGGNTTVGRNAQRRMNKTMRERANTNYTPNPDDDNDAFAMMQQAMRLLMESQNQSKAIDEPAIRRIAKSVCAEYLRDEIREVIVYQKVDGEEMKGNEDELYHPSFSSMITYLNEVDFRGNHINVMLVGPKSSGKSTAGEQAAALMGVPYYFHGVAGDVFDLMGFVDAKGEYQSTQFVKAFMNGGVVVLEELDNSAYDQGAIMALNNGLANGVLSLPNGEQVPRHKDCFIIGCGNTYGWGATADYSSRTKQDEAFRSRFPFKVDWPYAKEFELALVRTKTNDDDNAMAWCKEVQFVRDFFEEMGYPPNADLRTIEAGSNVIRSGGNVVQVRKDTYLAGLDQDQVKTTLDAVTSFLAGN